jgi:D-glycero-beta-D-manno-heptose-7-phosphate kinase
MRIQEGKLKELFDNIRGKRVAVVGDVMLDQYFWGHVSRISPEAPVPIVEVHSESIRLGGAANVANNIAAMGAEPLLFGVVGDDENGRLLQHLLRESGFSHDGIISDPTRPTTIKTRVIAHSQHIVRFDREKTHSVSSEVTERLLKSIRQKSDDIDAFVLQDYNKGVFTADVIRAVIAAGKYRNVPVTVDPKFNNFFAYRDVSVFKPNRRELEEAFGVKVAGDRDYVSYGAELLHRLHAGSILITRGEEGMTLIERNGKATHIPTRTRSVADVSGAGDTVIATLTVLLAAGATVLEASSIANFAGGIVCGEVGIVPIDRNKLIDTMHGFGDGEQHEPVRAEAWNNG